MAPPNRVRFLVKVIPPKDSASARPKNPILLFPECKLNKSIGQLWRKVESDLQKHKLIDPPFAIKKIQDYSNNTLDEDTLLEDALKRFLNVPERLVLQVSLKTPDPPAPKPTPKPESNPSAAPPSAPRSMSFNHRMNKGRRKTNFQQTKEVRNIHEIQPVPEPTHIRDPRPPQAPPAPPPQHLPPLYHPADSRARRFPAPLAPSPVGPPANSRARAFWTPAERALLDKLVLEEVPRKEICRVMGRSRQSLVAKMYELYETCMVQEAKLRLLSLTPVDRLLQEAGRDYVVRTAPRNGGHGNMPYDFDGRRRSNG